MESREACFFHWWFGSIWTGTGPFPLLVACLRTSIFCRGRNLHTGPIGFEGLRPPVWIGRRLLRGWPRARRPRVSNDSCRAQVGNDTNQARFVEYETANDLRNAVEKLDNREFKGQAVRCVQDVRPSKPSYYDDRLDSDCYQIQEERPRERYRSRSPVRGRGYGPPDDDYYRRGPPRGYSPRRDDYRRRSPARDYYDPRDRYARSPPRVRGPPIDDAYPPPRARYPDDPYDARGPPPPRRGYEPDPYMNGHDRPYGRPPSPRGRPRSPGARSGYDDGYNRRPYW